MRLVACARDGDLLLRSEFEFVQYLQRPLLLLLDRYIVYLIWIHAMLGDQSLAHEVLMAARVDLVPDGDHLKSRMIVCALYLGNQNEASSEIGRQQICEVRKELGASSAVLSSFWR